jgi:hypothetical protein
MLRSGLQQSRPDLADANCRATAVKTAIGGADAWLAGGRSLKPWGRVRT